MLLKDGETVIKVLHHHHMAHIFRMIKLAIISSPFYLVGYFISTALNTLQSLLLFGGITLVFGLIMAYDTVIFLLDRLIITNLRIIYIDWKGAFTRIEHEALLNDIQDIETTEAGILSALPFLDYGNFKLQTASARTTIIFSEAPDPEGIKHFIYHLNRKPNRIGRDNELKTDDKKAETNETPALTRRE